MKHLLMVLMVVCWFKIDANTSYLPVPGGWLYKVTFQDKYVGQYINIVYVPFTSNDNGHITITPLNPR